MRELWVSRLRGEMLVLVLLLSVRICVTVRGCVITVAVRNRSKRVLGSSLLFRVASVSVSVCGCGYGFSVKNVKFIVAFIPIIIIITAG